MTPYIAQHGRGGDAPKLRKRSRRFAVNLRWQRVVVVLASLSYVAALLVSLKLVVHPIWGYMGFGWTPPINPLRSLLILVLAVIPAVAIPLTFQRPSRLILWLLFVMVYVPAQIVPDFTSSVPRSYLGFQVTLCVCFLGLIIISELPRVAIHRPTFSPQLFWTLVLGLSAVTYVLVVAFFGVPTSIPRLGDVYSTRMDFREHSAGAPTLLAYLMSWQSKVINPMLIALGFVGRRPAMIAAGTLGQLFLYAFAGHKSVVFSILLVALIFVAREWLNRYLGSAAILGSLCLVILSTTVAMASGSIALVTLFVRRLLLLPGLLTGYYFDYFSNNPKTMALDPISRVVFDSVYEERVPRLIGRVFFDSTQTSANAHLWADGYAALGVAGMIIVTVVFGGILWAFNSLALERHETLVAILTAVPGFNTTNSALFASIGTHGIGVALLLLWIFPRQPHGRPAQTRDRVKVRTSRSIKKMRA